MNVMRTVKLTNGTRLIVSPSGEVGYYTLAVYVTDTLSLNLAGTHTAKSILKAAKLYTNVTRGKYAYQVVRIFNLCLGQALWLEIRGGSVGLCGKLGYRYGKVVLLYRGLNLALDNSFNLLGFK